MTKVRKEILGAVSIFLFMSLLPIGGIVLAWYSDATGNWIGDIATVLMLVCCPILLVLLPIMLNEEVRNILFRSRYE